MRRRLRCPRCDVWHECPAPRPGTRYRCGRCGEALCIDDPPAGTSAVLDIALDEVPLADAQSPERPAARPVTEVLPADVVVTPMVRVSTPATLPPLLPPSLDGPPTLATRAAHAPPSAPVPSPAAAPITLGAAELPHRTDATAYAGPPSPRPASRDPSLATAGDAARPATLSGDVGVRPGSFGRYEILEELGRGGMGIVYKARQAEIGRIVALKVLLAGSLAGEEDLRRFRREAAAAASLSHPGIVAVHDVGVVEGRPYFTMEFIQGKSLASRVAEAGPLPPPEALRLLRRICEAVHHAHEHGLVHRDLKPDNVLVRPDGSPVVTDFGLAKPMADNEHLTASGVLLGTLVYMSPEQASGDLSDVGPLSDVYSLGAVLYQLLTGRPPFEGVNPVSLLAHVILDDPVPPKVLRPGLASDVQTICLTAMAKSPARRYPSAQAFADDIGRFVAGESIVARPAGPLERAGRKLRKHRALAATVTASAAAVVLALGAFRFLPGHATVKTRFEDPMALGEWREAEAPPDAEVAIAPDGVTRPVANGLRVSLMPGRHEFRFRAPGYEEVERALEVSPAAGVEVPVDFRLLTGTLSPRVTHDLPAPPTPRYAFRDRAGRVHRRDAGEKTLRLPAGAYDAEVTGEGFFPVPPRRVEVVPGSDTPFPLALRALERWRFSWLVAGTFHNAAVFDPEGYGSLQAVLGDSAGLVLFLSYTGKTLGSAALVGGAVYGRPGIGDVDGDGTPDVVVAARLKRPDGGAVHALSGKEGHAPLWTWRGAERLGAAPAVFDTDGDGRADVVVQGDAPGGRLACLSGRDGSARWRFPADEEAGFPAGAGAVVADLTADGVPSVVAVSEEGGCVALDARDGRVRWRRPGDGRPGLRAGAWVGELDGTPPNEVVYVGPPLAAGAGVGAPAGPGRRVPASVALWCVSGADGAPRWSVPLPGPIAGAPVARDWDGDGLPDLAAVTLAGNVRVVSGKDGRGLWQAEVTGPVVAAPAAADLDGDGSPELLVTSREGLLSAFSASGRLLWTYRGEGEGTAAPIVADLDADGTPEVLAPFTKGVRCLSGSLRLRWSARMVNRAHGLDVADADGDGVADVWAFVEQDKLYCLSGRDGAVLWGHPASLSRPVFAVGDLLGTGVPCAVFGRGTLQAIGGAPGLVPKQRRLWEAEFGAGAGDQFPAIGDLDRDGCPEVVAGDSSGAVRVLSGKDRRVLWGVDPPGYGPLESKPVLADVNGDGVPDVALVTALGKVCVLDGRDGRPLWAPADAGSPCAASPAVADWDGDGTPDLVVTATDRRTSFLSGRDGRPLRAAVAGQEDPGSGAGKRHGSPVLADLDGDGAADAVLTPGRGRLYVVDGKSGRTRELKLPGGVVAGSAVARLAPGRELQIVVACMDGRAYCLAPSGRVLWWYPTGDWVDRPPLLRDLDGDGAPEVLLSAKDNRIYCLSGRVATGK
ncbi:MAG: VCBS repeat-containing protein [Planctomycetes bacterium]|nr:VCBS repeat-containing protein [Planctomycetota bacterium]